MRDDRRAEAATRARSALADFRRRVQSGLRTRAVRARELAALGGVALLVVGVVVAATAAVAVVVAETATLSGDPLVLAAAWTLGFAFAVTMPLFVLRIVVAFVTRFEL